ncbi:MAG: hypothetical protein ABIN48_10600 [Ginsengibacter sp.]
MSISPAINIGIGSYGANCIEKLADNFVQREQFFLDYLSFHQLIEIDEMIASKTHKKGIFEPEQLDDQASMDNDWRLGNFLSGAYNHLINLNRSLNSKVNFGAIHINLFFAAYETGHIDLLCKTILKIDELKEQGTFGEVQVKCYSVLSDGKALSTKAQEESIVETLSKLVDIRRRYNVLSHIFIFDDKNTCAVSLGIHRDSLPFAMMEIVIVFLQNEYRMTGSLISENRVFSLGLGMVYFDELFFRAFMKNLILQTKIRLEKIHDGDKMISTIDYREIIDKKIIPYLNKELPFEKLIEAIEKVTAPVNFINTMRCYEFLLLNLLGHHDKIELIEPIDKEELFSIQDIIYQKLYEEVLTETEIEEKTLLDLKEYKKRVSEHDVLVKEDDPRAEEMKKLLSEHEESVEKLIQQFSVPKRRKVIVVKSKIRLLEKTAKELESEVKKLKEDFENKNIFGRFFGKGRYKKFKAEIKDKIVASDILLNEERKSIQSKSNELQFQLEQLYKLQDTLSNKIKTLLDGKVDIFELKRKYQKELDAIAFLDYEFLHNIISPHILEEYETNHRDTLQHNLKGVLRTLFEESIRSRISFKKLLDNKISDQVNSIIDFKMNKYLLNEYDEMNLLKSYDFVNDLMLLKQRAFPFFNAIPSYTPKPHSLKYFNDADKIRTEKLRELLDGNYTGNIPSFIPVQSDNKFALITIEMVENLNDIVKFNNHFQRVNAS